MQRNAAVLTVVCLMTCLTFNYTFPLRRKIPRESGEVFFLNQSRKFSNLHHDSLVERNKHLVSSLENALKKIRTSTQEFSKEMINQMSSGFRSNILSGQDLQQYEKMVIMKKYPYLDLKELELKYSPPKQLRQNQKFAEGSNVENEPGIWEPLEDGPNVEIINRGLTGFAIPLELTRHTSETESKEIEEKIKTNNECSDDDTSSENPNKIRKCSVKEILGSLKTDIKEYVEMKNKLD